MNGKRTWAIFRKECLFIRRDPRSLILIILLPVMLLLIYGYALTFDVKDVPLAVYDLEGSPVSRSFIEAFSGSRYFHVHRRVDNFAEIGRLITDRKVRLGLVVPPDFSQSLKKGRAVGLQIILDGSEPHMANIILGYAKGVVGEYNQRLLAEQARVRGWGRLEMPVLAEARFWFNEELTSINFIVPGLMVVIMTMVGALLTALTVVRERERGSLERLISTPLRKSELLLGKLGPYFLVGMLDMVIIMVMAQTLFEVPRHGSDLLLLGLAAVFLICMLAQGLLISVVAETQLQAFQMAVLTTFLPSILLSGFVFPLRLMPWPLQLISYVVPARYLVTISKGIYLKGVGLKVLWPEALLQVAFAALFLGAALNRFSKKIR